MNVVPVLAGEKQWAVLCEDALELLPRILPGYVALLCADPPYGVSERTNRKSNGRCSAAGTKGKRPREVNGRGLLKSHDFAPVIGDDKPFDPAPLLAFPRVILWGANHYGDKLPASPSWLVWDKRAGTTPDDNADCELAWSNLGGPARLFAHLWRGTCRASETGTVHLHPTQKPVALFRWILERTTKPGDLVLDPYCGSGPCGVASVALGRRYIGCDLAPEYAELTRERIKAELAGSTLEAARVGQIAMFGTKT